jgi:hypothetical protein
VLAEDALLCSGDSDVSADDELMPRERSVVTAAGVGELDDARS